MLPDEQSVKALGDLCDNAASALCLVRAGAPFPSCFFALNAVEQTLEAARQALMQAGEREAAKKEQK